MVALTADDIDCIIAYIVPLDLWYVVPVEHFRRVKIYGSIPTAAKKDLASRSFREAWWLLNPELKDIDTIPLAMTQHRIQPVIPSEVESLP